MVNINSGPPGFRALGLWRFKVPRLQRISHLHTKNILNHESMNTSTSLPVMTLHHVTSTLWDFKGFFLPLHHEPILPQCQVPRPWDLTPRVPHDQWLRLTTTFGSSILNAICNTFPPEYQVSGLHDLAPCM
jgi:hypothetical protein